MKYCLIYFQAGRAGAGRVGAAAVFGRVRKRLPRGSLWGAFGKKAPALVFWRFGKRRLHEE